MVYRLSQSYSVSGWLVKEYVYCPMIPWIITHYNLVEPPTQSMVDGLEIDRDYIEEVLGEIDLGYSDLLVEEPITLDDGTVIRIDALARNGREYTLVEIKRYRRKHYSDQKAQLKAYAYLLTRHGKPVHNMILVQERKVRYRRRFEEVDLREMEEIIERLRQVIESDKPPMVKPSRKCWSCWYRKICPTH